MAILNIANIVKESTVDGIGIRYTIFVQGCPHHCEGCHNPSTWPFNTGTDISAEAILKDILKSYDYLQGVTFSGGEPFMQYEPLSEIAKSVRSKGMDVWCYTGYNFEELVARPEYKDFLCNIDVLVDGRYDRSKRDLCLPFRGSSNQRLIDVQRSLSEDGIILKG